MINYYRIRYEFKEIGVDEDKFCLCDTTYESNKIFFGNTIADALIAVHEYTFRRSEYITRIISGDMI